MQISSSSGSPQMQVQKLPTGIEGFDDVCHGGLPIGRSTLISGTSERVKPFFPCIFSTMELLITMSPEFLSRLRSRHSIFCVMLQVLVGTCKRWWSKTSSFILDASPDPDGQDVAGSFDLSGLIERINYAIRKYKAKRVAIDSITAVFQQYDAVFVVRREIFRLIARLKEIGVTT